MGSFRLPEQADASRGGRPPLNYPGVRLPARPAVRGTFVTPCGRRTVRTRHPWLVPSFRRRPVGSSWPAVVPQRFGRLWETPAGDFFVFSLVQRCLVIRKPVSIPEAYRNTLSDLKMR